LSQDPEQDIHTDLVLVGGGHAHVQVLRRLMMRPLPGVRTTVVLDRPVAVYSGMVPGFVAGDYAESELEIDVVPLARRARARVVGAAAVRIDPVAQRVALEGRPSIPYDFASLDVGSSVRGLDLPGVREHALSTRPIGRFVSELDARVATVAGAGPIHVVVVGGGVAGVELAFTVRARLGAAGCSPSVCVLAASPRLLPGYADRVVQGLAGEAARWGIEMRAGVEVSAVEKDAVLTDAGRVPADLVLWATGASAPRVVAESPLPHDDAGFVRVRDTLQVEGHDALFAAGDCAALESAWVRKAGVYAVREGPVLDANLRAAIEQRSLTAYRPQRDFLTLLNLGGRRALATKWGLAAAGTWAWTLKDVIDRRFMRRFRVLADDGALADDFPTPESMGMEEMACGGCAAKVGASPLSRALARLPMAPEDASVRLGVGDDAAVLALPRGDVMLATLDAFRAFADDPWLVGRVSAVNALSDVHAKGGRPRHALAIVNVPEIDPVRAEETLYQTLAGIRAALDPLGVSLVGGHSTQGPDLYVGLSITGSLDDDESWLPLDGARPGDRLLLSKPIGSGVLLAADMQGRARGRDVEALHASLVRANADAAAVAKSCGATACTDVSGFGLAGHLAELLRASAVSARLDADALPLLDGALALATAGVRSTYHEQNAEARRGLAVAPVVPDALVELLFDPQTSGGLLMSVPAERCDEALAALRGVGDGRARAIGVVTEARADGAAFEVVAGQG
jgi:selenide,water dikinase